jgi:hypothetical protein
MAFRLTDMTTREIVNGETVLLSDSGDTAVLNSMAASMLDLLLTSGDISQAQSAILADYEVEQPEVGHDVQTFIHSLCAAGFIEAC